MSQKPISAVDKVSTSPITQSIEVHSIDWIPEHERHGTPLKQALFWFIPNFNIFSVALGLIGPGLGLSPLWTIVAGALGAIVGGFFVSFHASQGPVLGLPQMIQSRAQFGYQGVIIPTVVMLFMFLVFNVLQTDVLKSGLEATFGWNPVLVIIGVSILAALLAIFGHDWLHRTFRILFLCSAPFFILLTIGILAGAGASGTAEPMAGLGFNVAGFAAVFAAAMSYNLTLAPYISDYTRYLPASTKTWKVVLAVQAGICIALVWLMGIGAWLAAYLGTTDAVVGLTQVGNSMFPASGTITAILAMVALVAVIGINTYSAGIAVLTALDCIRPVKPTRTLRIVATLVLLLIWATVNLNLQGDQSTLITNLLSVLLYLLVPWTAVNLTDFFLVRKGHYAITEIVQRHGLYGDWSWRGMAAYAIGLVAEIPFMSFSFWKGPFAQLIGFDVAFIVGLVVSGAAYLLFTRNLKVEAEQGAIARSEAILEKLN